MDFDERARTYFRSDTPIADSEKSRVFNSLHSDNFTDFQVELHSSLSGNPLFKYFWENKERNPIWKHFHYFDAYHRHLNKFVGQRVNLLEIGIYGGGSLEMWRDYFGKASRIIGIDIEKECEIHRGDGIEVYIGSQQDKNFLRKVMEQESIDICVDDGSHNTKHQATSFEAIFPKINPGGIYIIEDIGGTNNKFADYISGLIKSMNFISETKDTSKWLSYPNYLQQWVRCIHYYPQMLIVEKHKAKLREFTSRRIGTHIPPFSPGEKE